MSRPAHQALIDRAPPLVARLGGAGLLVRDVHAPSFALGSLSTPLNEVVTR